MKARVEEALGNIRKAIRDAVQIEGMLCEERDALNARVNFTASDALEALRQIAIARVRAGKSVRFYRDRSVHWTEGTYAYQQAPSGGAYEEKLVVDRIVELLKDATMIAAESGE